MKDGFNISKSMFAAATVCLATATSASAHGNGNNPGSQLGPYIVGEQGVLFVGGTYDVAPNTGSPTTMANQSYVFYQIPASPTNRSWSWKRTGRVPIIMIHGGSQTGANFLGTPDGRPGWAEFYVKQGWPVYVIDQPGRGKSGYFPNAYGPQGPTSNPSTTVQRFTAPELSNPLQWPQAKYHTQWPGGPGSGVPGQYAFDPAVCVPGREHAERRSGARADDGGSDGAYQEDRAIDHHHTFDDGTGELVHSASQSWQGESGSGNRTDRKLQS
jgi:hypothetical protein